MVQRTGIDPVSSSFIDRQTFTRQGTLIDRRNAGDNRSVTWDPLTRPDHDHVTHSDLFEGQVKFPAVAQDVGDVGAEGEQTGDGLGGPAADVAFQAFAAEGNKHDQRRNRWFAHHDRRQAGQSQGQVRADSAFKQSLQCLVQDPRTAEDCRQQCQTEAKHHAIVI